MKKQVLVYSLVSIRGLALALSLVGQSKASQILYAAADAAEAGVNIDAHMADIAEKLKAQGNASNADWDDVMARIRADSDALQKA